ncbi:ROK family transcriptional regulator [uncultured Microbacterium sp.]|uniref:ROK family transcriptional regulator n=1 Tax=uncultured Microbacterium sp. TaxID=191216 RepID=UPI0025E9CA76|nr:ROK family transcriptional regulator [uncultured Microbacterium sp.]
MQPLSAALPVFSPQTLAVLTPLRTGAARSRAELAAHTGLSPSTVTARVDPLIAAGVIVEDGTDDSRGGRRPRRLAIRGDLGTVASIDLGVERSTIGLVDYAGTALGHRHLALDLTEGPDAVLRRVARELDALATATGGLALTGAAIALPGPVSAQTGRLVAPSRMPGWHDVDVAALLSTALEVPALASNDANCMAVGELVGGDAEALNQVFIKAGSGIGSGVVAGGQLYTGRSGAAGDISHVTVPGAAPVPCSCGRVGCLDAVASGSALTRAAQEAGRDVTDVETVIDLARNGDALATGLLREAGSMTGGVLATIVNFFTPDRLVVGGSLSASDVFIAAIRSKLWADCLPMATENLEVAAPRHPRVGGILGAARLFLDAAFGPEAARSALRIAARA